MEHNALSEITPAEARIQTNQTKIIPLPQITESPGTWEEQLKKTLKEKPEKMDSFYMPIYVGISFMAPDAIYAKIIEDMKFLQARDPAMFERSSSPENPILPKSWQKMKRGPTMNNSNNGLDDMITPLCKIRGIADLFSATQENETREITSDGADGIFLILSEAVREIQDIVAQEKCRQREKREIRDQKLYAIRVGEVQDAN